MGVKIFRDSNWDRIRNGVISRRDLAGLEADKDGELIGYLIAHAPATCRESMQRYAAKKFGISEAPKPSKNTDDPNDKFYEEYFVLREQVGLEDDFETLKKAALDSPDRNIAAFAFCRLTGYRFSPGDNDAYSYRTFACVVLPGIKKEDVREFCRIIVLRGGPFKDEAEKILSGL
ncbi:MAG: hypothetical protein IJV00_10615 [Clostridia bacterium]|nr:hypothetical protein [Clostridia bacterium]